jgi:alpha-L-arabinofuranosidase
VTRIVVHLDEARAISPDLWGVFFEDINHAADGGLYAELVQNRSFSYSDADAPGWDALTAWRTEGNVQLRADSPLSSSAPTYARLDASRGPARLVNDGFGGIVLREGREYRFSVFVRVGRASRLAVQLVGGDGTVIASTVIVVWAADEWTRYDATLLARGDAVDGSITLTAPTGSTVDVDFVSLFPQDVFAASEESSSPRDDNGLRRDIATAIADLRPRFVRFPGGCVAHGLGIDNMYRWPESIGPVHERRQDSNLWGYHQSRGLGYYEMFFFCSRIGATPLPVVAAGVCCQNTIGGPLPLPDAEMDAYVQEVLDLVEFANGDESTHWGAVRASLGHPEPFGLRYLGVGNEDQIDDVFRSRFSRLLLALREHHPEIQVVGTAGPSPQGADFEAGWELARELAVPLVDEHSYKSPRWFFQNVHRYDDYDRSGPRVYLGEYGSWGNTMLNALAEAAFMTGIERNGDIVALASYAPLLGKVGHSQWVPDLIYFDGSEVHETLNYHVQALFSQTAGGLSHPLDLHDAPTWERPLRSRTRIAVASDAFAVRCTSVSVAGEAVPDVALTLPYGRVELPVDLDVVDVDVRMTLDVGEGDSDRGSFSIHIGDLAGGEQWEWNFGTWLNRTLTLHSTTDGFRDEAAPGVPFRLETGRAYEIAVAIHDGGTRFSVTVDGHLLQSHVDLRDPEYRFVASCVTNSSTGKTWVRVVNATDTEVAVGITDERGDPVSGHEARALTAAATEGGPFVAAPASPQALPLGDDLRIPAWSVTVVDITSPRSVSRTFATPSDTSVS